MAFKFVAFAAVLACASAGVINTPYHGYPAVAKVAAPLAYHQPALSYAAPVAKIAAAPVLAKAAVPEPYDAHPQYHFGYQIEDGLTGDVKSQQESRDGDVVQGSYSLIDADGFKRTVEYTADPVHGFNAVVHREPLVQKAVVAKAVAPVAYAAPVAKVAAPVAYAPAVAKVATPLAYAPAVAKVAAPLGYASPAAHYYH